MIENCRDENLYNREKKREKIKDKGSFQVNSNNNKLYILRFFFTKNTKFRF